MIWNVGQEDVDLISHFCTTVMGRDGPPDWREGGGGCGPGRVEEKAVGWADNGYKPYEGQNDVDLKAIGETARMTGMSVLVGLTRAVRLGLMAL